MKHAIQEINKKSLQQKAAALPTAQKIPNLPSIEIQKSLNWLAMAVGLYTLVCAYVGSIYFSKPDKLMNKQQELISLAQETIEKLEKDLNKRYHYTTNQNHQMAHLEKSIKSAIELTQTDYERKIQLRDNEIETLKNDIRDLNVLLSQNMDKHAPKAEALTYSLENYRILRYEQNQKLKRFKSGINARKDAYLKTLDLQKAQDRAKWQEFQDNLDREYFALKEKFDGISRKFYQEKYIVLNE